jgi:fatty-acyl-CoA synthase
LNCISLASPTAVLHPLNVRLSASEVRFQLEHARSRVLIFDREYRQIITDALDGMTEPPLALEVIDRFASYDHEPSRWPDYETACLVRIPHGWWLPEAEEGKDSLSGA